MGCHVGGHAKGAIEDWSERHTGATPRLAGRGNAPRLCIRRVSASDWRASRYSTVRRRLTVRLPFLLVQRYEARRTGTCRHPLGLARSQESTFLRVQGAEG